MAVADQQSPAGSVPRAPGAGRTGPSAGGRAAPPRRSLAGHATRHSLRLFWAWCLAGPAALAVFALLLLLALASGPVALPSWVTARIEAQLNRGLPAGRVTLSRIELALGEGLSRLRLRNVGIYDATGAEVARLNEVGAGLSVAALLQGEVVPERLRLSGAQVTVRRRADGAFDLSFGAIGNVAGSLPAILDRIDHVFASGPLAGTDRIEATDLTVTLEDARSGRVWQVTGGRVVLTQTDSELSIALDCEVFNGTEDLAQVSATFRSAKGTLGARVEAEVRNARTGDIALQSPALSFLSLVDAPIGGAVQIGVDGTGRVSAISAQLSVGSGVLDPGGPLAEPLRIEGGELRLAFDPARQRIGFDRLRVQTDRGDLDLAGQAFLRDLGPGGWPGSFEGQFALRRLASGDLRLFAAPVEFREGLAEVRLRLAPVRLDLGRLRLGEGAEAIELSGRLAMTATGPDLALDLAIGRIGRDRLLQLWPPALAARSRDWVLHNIAAGTVTGARMGLRRSPGGRPRVVLDFGFEGAEVTWMRTMPHIVGARGYASLAEDRFYVHADAGTVLAPQGGEIEIAGSDFSVADTRAHPAWADVSLSGAGAVTAMLSLLDQEPLKVMQRAGQPVDLAGGQSRVAAVLRLPLKEGLAAGDIAWQGTADLWDLSSSVLVPGRRVAAARMQARSDGRMVEVRGPVLLDGLPADVVWTSGIGEGGEPARVEAGVTLDQQFLDTLGIALPSGMVSGSGAGSVTIDLPRGEAPAFRLVSDLRGITLRLPAVGYSKGGRNDGRLEVSGRLGSPPEIDSLRIEGGGLRAGGRVSLTADGGLAAATFDRVRLNGWLDAPVTLTGRGAGAIPAVAVRGGTLDFRKADFGAATGAGAGGPVTVALDRLIVSDGIELTGFRGEFTTRGGFGGSFTARLNGGGILRGTVVPQAGGSALRVVSDNAGSVLKDAGVAQRVRGGAMELVLVPTGKEGIYDGSLKAQHLRVRGTPALAELLNAVSIVGLLQQLNGDGLVFDEAQARFVLTPNAINVTRGSAIGASLGISAQGSYMLGTGELDFRGVFSPVFLLNGIGQIVSRRGEGLFGFNYRVRGTSGDPQVSVNPLSILTPGIFREIFQSAPPAVR